MAHLSSNGDRPVLSIPLLCKARPECQANDRIQYSLAPPENYRDGSFGGGGSPLPPPSHSSYLHNNLTLRLPFINKHM